MKNILYAILFLCLINSCSSGVGGDDLIEPNDSTIVQNDSYISQWYKTFGGEGYEGGHSVQQTQDGGYIICGNGDIVKTDGSGNEQWAQTFNAFDFYSVQQTTDGGYIITGWGSGMSRAIAMKINDIGNTIWWDSYTQSTINNINSSAYSIQQTTDGGYIITGTSSSTSNIGNGSTDVYLIKINENGIEQWSQIFGDYSEDRGNSVQQTQDGGYIITGSTNSYGNGISDVYLIKTDSQGDSIWTKTFGGEYIDEGLSIQQTLDGGYIIVGNTESFGNGNSDIYLIKTDENGSELWFKTYGGTAVDEGLSVQQTLDGGYIIVGNTESFGNGNRDVYLIKTDENGNEQWTKTLGGEDDDYGRSVQQTTDGGYIICGTTLSFGNGYSDIYLIKTDESGNITP